MSESNELTNAEKLRGLPWSMAANAANTVFAQFTVFGSAFILFLDRLSLSKSQIGLLFSFFPYAGLVALFIAPWVARFGYKRTFITFWGLRKIVTAGFLLTPWVLSQFGSQAAIFYIGLILLTFALCRAIAETGYYPWVQEFVPDSVRGKYSATDSIFTLLTGFVAVLIAGFVVGQSNGLGGFMGLFAVGVGFGLLCVWAEAHVPGGAPVPTDAAGHMPRRDFATVLRDRRFLRYMFGVSLMIVAINPIASFLPLFMEDQVGLSSGHVVLLQTGGLLGSLLSTYLWGWAADRYGSRPIIISGLVLRLLLPLCWIFMPRHSPISLAVALSITAFQGVADMGWAIGSGRLLFVDIVPPALKRDYMALFYAWAGLIGGTSQLLGGQILQFSAGLNGRLLFFPVDPYLPLFALGLILPLFSLLLFAGLRSAGDVTVGEFAGLFFKGNPFLAATSLVRYNFARDERTAVAVTEHLGRSKSPLTVDELLEALADPRFNVRFEAIISIARMQPDRRLTMTLSKILHGRELSLSVMAAWALGRIGDQEALEPLRQGLNSEYRSIRAHCARALGSLDDRSMIPLLLERLRTEPDKGLQMAYASALGNLQAQEAAPMLLAVLEQFENEGARLELALSLARLVGDEHHFIRIARQMRSETGTAIAQAVGSLKKKVRELNGTANLLDRCADAFAREDMAQGADLLAQIIDHLPLSKFTPPAAAILQQCATQFRDWGGDRREYILLALHTIQTGR